jgi:adenine phosphoribosyltransferase
MEKSYDYLKELIRDIPDFPIEGVLFRDITTLLKDTKGLKDVIDIFSDRYRNKGIKHILGADARGFIFGAAIAYNIGAGFVPIRKKGKLPSTTLCEKYELEYGFDEVEVHFDAFRDIKKPKVLLIDDLVVSGGTAVAAANLIEKLDASLVEACFILNFSILPGKAKLEEKTPVYAVLEI